MKNLLLKHYLAIAKRGKIDKNTTFADFFEKMNEEDVEAVMALSKKGYPELSSEFVQEMIDSIMTRINLLTHLNVDFIEELKKNIEYQEIRED